MEPMTVDPFAGSPDFARLYGDPDSALSPRMASQLWTTAIYLVDTYADSDLPDLLKRELPPVARRMADDVWMERFIACFEGIAARLARGRFASSQLASCTGEEMALHLIIDAAEAAVSDETIPLDESLPADPSVTATSNGRARSCSATTTSSSCSTRLLTGSRTTTAISASATCLPTSIRGAGSFRFRISSTSIRRSEDEPRRACAEDRRRILNVPLKERQQPRVAGLRRP